MPDRRTPNEYTDINDRIHRDILPAMWDAELHAHAAALLAIWPVVSSDRFALVTVILRHARETADARGLVLPLTPTGEAR